VKSDTAAGDVQQGLKTERLDCGTLALEHAASLFVELQNPGLYTFIPQDPPADLESLAQRFKRLSEQPYSPDRSQWWLNWAMRDRESGGYVGMLEATVIPARQAAYIAYFVFEPHQRRGYGREGVAALLDHLFDRYGVNTVIAEIDTRNLASIALVRSLGFAQVRHTVGADFFKGASSDEFRFELRWDAWQANTGKLPS
jgi:RimJ/RimL family protein N-acetyltransferase